MKCESISVQTLDRYQAAHAPLSRKYKFSFLHEVSLLFIFIASINVNNILHTSLLLFNNMPPVTVSFITKAYHKEILTL